MKNIECQRRKFAPKISLRNKHAKDGADGSACSGAYCGFALTSNFITGPARRVVRKVVSEWLSLEAPMIEGGDY
jgi:hypothetical protein